MFRYKLYSMVYIFVVALFFVIGARFVYTKEFNQFKIKNLYLDEIKSGDTFLVSYQQYYRIFEESFCGLNFTHSSTAYWENGMLYFIEYANYTEEWNGIMKIPFHMWFKFNKNAIILVNKLDIKQNEDIERKNINKNIKLFYNEFNRKDDLDSSFSLFGWNRFRRDYRNSNNIISHLWNTLLGQPQNSYKKINPEVNKEITCVEVTACLLCECGVVKKNKSISYAPSKFIGMKDFQLNDNYYFSDYFICDISNFKNL